MSLTNDINDARLGRGALDPVELLNFPALGYEQLADVLRRAHHHAAYQKGKERHASEGQPFGAQPMTSINQLIGSVDGFLYQAIKKSIESKRLKTGPAVAELLGAINYLAGAIMERERLEHLTPKLGNHP